MKKRFLALFTAFSILSAFSMSLATNTSGNTTSGSILPPATSTSGDNLTSGDNSNNPSTNVSGDMSGDISGDESGETLVITAKNDTIEIEKNTILTASMLATTTIQNSTLTYIIVEQPMHGTLVHTEATKAEFTYTPDLDYIGADSFTFKVSDGTNVSNIATISIQINVPSEEIIPFYYIDMQEHWANYSASHLAARGLIIGEEIGSRFYFYPNRQMTRADFILFLLAITESNEDANIEIPDVTFADSSNTPDWLIEAAKLAYAKGIIKGSANGNQLYLNPYNALTRKEAVVMINNILKLTNATDALTYKDASTIPEWATQAVKNLTAYKIIQGNDSNEFKPNRIISKAEAAEMCYKLIKQMETEEMPNVSGDIK